MTCPACHGEGGVVIPVLDYGQGPVEPCGYCRGRGFFGPQHRTGYYRTLGYLAAEARAAKRHTDAQA